MKSVFALQNALREFVPDAFVDSPRSETAQAGNYPAVPAWSGNSDTRAQLSIAPGFDQDEYGGAAQPIFEFAAEADINVDRALGSGLGDHVRRSALVSGIDGLAWYVSFHLRGRQWGIYLPVTSIVGVAETVFGSTKLELAAKMKLAAHVMHEHELFHFAVDYMCGLWELADGHPLWKPGQNLRTHAGYYELEEKLANANMLRRINAVTTDLKAAGRAAALRQFISQQPAGYRDAVHAVAPRAFQEACEQLCIGYIEEWNGGQVPEEVYRPVLSELFPVGVRMDWRYCPVHIVHDGQRFSLPDLAASLFATVQWVDEPESFREQLLECDTRIRKAWEGVKRKLAATVRAPGLDFKLWARHGKNLEFSVRVDSNFRAHLLFDPGTGGWTALSIGSHANMGHG